MSRDLSYPYEKLVVAIYCLAGKASLQRRLKIVYMSCLIRLKPEDFEDQDMRRSLRGDYGAPYGGRTGPRHSNGNE
jgi:hypothetical protein